MKAKIKTYQYEPFSRLMIDKLNFNGATRLLIYLVLFGGISIIISVLEGNFIYQNSAKISYLKDFSTFIDFLILNPLVLFFIQKYLIKYSRTIEKLARKEIIVLDNSKVKREIRNMKKYFTSKLPFFLTIIISIGVMCFHVLNISKYDSYFIFDSNYFMGITGWYIIVMTTFYIYLLLYSLQIIYFLIRIKRKIFKQEVKIQLLHEDRCGGLKKVGDLCMILNYSLFLLAITLVLFLLADMYLFDDAFSFRVLLAMPIYIIGTIFIFFFPLMPIHKKMEEERTRHLEIIGQKFDLCFDCLTNDDGTINRNELENVKDLKDIFKWMEKIPKWPIDTKMYIQFSLTILIPTVIFLIELISNLKSIKEGLNIIL